MSSTHTVVLSQLVQYFVSGSTTGFPCLEAHPVKQTSPHASASDTNQPRRLYRQTPAYSPGTVTMPGTMAVSHIVAHRSDDMAISLDDAFMLSADALRAIWDTPEEDEAWKDL